MLKKPELISTETIPADFKFHLQKLNYQQDGRSVRIDRVDHAGAVVVLPLSSAGKILAIRQFRHAMDSFLIELPAGKLELAEAPLPAAQREIQEEIGFLAGKITDLGMIYPGPGFTNEKMYCYLASELSPSKLKADADELIEVLELTPGEFAAKIRSGEITDAKSIAVFCRYLLQSGIISLS